MAAAKKKATTKRAATKRAATRKPAAVTPQVDRSRSTSSEPVPTKKQVDETGQRAEGLEYTPKRPTLKAAGLDQHKAEADRQAELQTEREEHNRRTGGS